MNLENENKGILKLQSLTREHELWNKRRKLHYVEHNTCELGRNLGLSLWVRLPLIDSVSTFDVFRIRNVIV